MSVLLWCTTDRNYLKKKKNEIILTKEKQLSFSPQMIDSST